MGDWGLGIGPNPQSPIPNPQSPTKKIFLNLYYLFHNFAKIKKEKILKLIFNTF